MRENKYEYDKKRYSNGHRFNFIPVGLFFMFCFRTLQSKKFIVSKMIAFLGYKFLQNIYGLEISRNTIIGKGFYIGHPWGITINPKVVLGDNINIHKGVVIGQQNRGKKQGCPVIGNCVWIGINAAIVGKIKIGNDVLIAPNSYINCDIPDHSIVFGNPCIIKHCDNATEGYINNIV